MVVRNFLFIRKSHEKVEKVVVCTNGVDVPENIYSLRSSDIFPFENDQRGKPVSWDVHVTYVVCYTNPLMTHSN